MALGSYNAGLEDPARDQVLKWKIKAPFDKAGTPLQIDGPLAFAFQARIEESASNSQVERGHRSTEHRASIPSDATKWNAPAGKSFKTRIGINEKGEQTGTTFPPNAT